jgi:hypothetical protein
MDYALCSPLCRLRAVGLQYDLAGNFATAMSARDYPHSVQLHMYARPYEPFAELFLHVGQEARPHMIDHREGAARL